MEFTDHLKRNADVCVFTLTRVQIQAAQIIRTIKIIWNSGLCGAPFIARFTALFSTHKGKINDVVNNYKLATAAATQLAFHNSKHH